MPLTLLICDLGISGWDAAYALQQRLVATRKSGLIDDVLLFCEHPHVITLGRSANQKNLLASEHVLRQKGVELRETNRGGDITYHGPPDRRLSHPQSRSPPPRCPLVRSHPRRSHDSRLRR